MKTGIKVLIGALAFVVTNAYAAEFMTKLEFEKVESQYTKIGDISTSSAYPEISCSRGFIAFELRQHLLWRQR